MIANFHSSEAKKWYGRFLELLGINFEEPSEIFNSLELKITIKAIRMSVVEV